MSTLATFSGALNLSLIILFDITTVKPFHFAVGYIFLTRRTETTNMRVLFFPQLKRYQHFIVAAYHTVMKQAIWDSVTLTCSRVKHPMVCP
ncbi:uncharacterized protein BCR38DRAFT_231880 [Pseudomassariella vexata]|uniref:Uncharacterized protein n=1 Tax=Pseudomassariella vexata TaxID=1141098 RepID=A0A1Y2DWL6_9PEZI|nr:uncharacterized protein BCR38DRAFT_231880 [Pseudomassariella vexata]ORY63589.1 hypothetical protein BCR38DRAFT_231880 [Pseudomassariella vexata]